ncbi:MAG: GPW/gp25 family protein [Opitutales bacterium]|nr:GPW/gp25 family protein [Opitutales bacterium]
MNGTDKRTGKRLTGLEHLRQSVADILSTPVGSRVMRRDYGSRLHALVDAPLTPDTLARIRAAAAEALGRWEPRLRLTRVRAAIVRDGEAEIEVVGYYKHNGAEIVLRGIRVNASP